MSETKQVKTSMTIRRSGTFECTVTGNKHCTPASATTKKRTIMYDAYIVADDSLRDKDGFTCDNAIFAQVFDSFTVVSESCEELCKRAARELFKRMLDGHLSKKGNTKEEIKRNSNKVYKVCVRIYGMYFSTNNNAYAEFLWERA